MSETPKNTAMPTSRRQFIAQASIAAAVGATGSGCVTTNGSDSAVEISAAGEFVMPPDAVRVPEYYSYTIRDHVQKNANRKKRATDADFPSRNNAHLYESLDLMFYLLHGITYYELYGKLDATDPSKRGRSVKELLDKYFLPRINDQKHQQEYFTRRQAGELTAELRQLSGKLAAYNPLGLRQVYNAPLVKAGPHPKDATPAGDARINAVAVHMGNCKRIKSQFCLPFLYVQILEPDIDQDFLSIYGCHSLHDLQIHSRNSNQNDCSGRPWPSPGDVRNAYKRGFFFMHEVEAAAENGAPVDVIERLLGDSKCSDPNGHACNGTGDGCLANHPTCFCTLAEDESCSILSCCD